MLAASSSSPTTNTTTQRAGEADPFIQYARSLHDYTLRLWTESRRIAEEKARLKAAAAATTGNQRHAQAPSQKKPDNASSNA
ncbi:hypothetical protein PYCCODRAFT_1434448 [Trametes coccinea BRFM310]|uniref:Uncharacterized protein n=1 Tax=Trametes coccinea (strain BRFM310) TaxID=1353009 RepID=A0A1Y2IR22_TRAC3|nr:hypothetical protein PYCCODRAFT_1434448 [Trametes coccinea BRFM310]